MKKLVVAALAAIFMLAMSSCAKDVKDAFDCVDTASDLIIAASDYSNNPTKSNCDAYKELLEDYIDECDLSDSEEASYKESLDALDCSSN